VIIDSQVTLSWSHIVSGDGGAGGKGGVGSAGQQGGDPGAAGVGVDANGNASTSYSGESGGKGGDGSRGGHAGAGGGGPSIGIVVAGEEPLLSDCTFNLGQPGMGGEFEAGPAAPDGASGEIYQAAR
jgi:hypothetical protein